MCFLCCFGKLLGVRFTGAQPKYRSLNWTPGLLQRLDSKERGVRMRQRFGRSFQKAAKICLVIDLCVFNFLPFSCHFLASFLPLSCVATFPVLQCNFCLFSLPFPLRSCPRCERRSLFTEGPQKAYRRVAWLRWARARALRFLEPKQRAPQVSSCRKAVPTDHWLIHHWFVTR